MTTQRSIRLGSRGSGLALAQTESIAAELAGRGHKTETVIISTRGDRDLTKPLPELGGKGVFTEELEAALRTADIDLAVHSLKDLPVDDVPGLLTAACPERADPRDVLITRNGCSLAALAAGGRIGTGSLRRIAQLRIIRPDLVSVPLRGNIDTRIRKVLDPGGDYDAIILAAAGLHRLGLDKHITEYLTVEQMLPAPGQGAIGIQCRINDDWMKSELQTINHNPTRAAVTAERTFLAKLGGGCQLPLGALATIDGDALTCQGLVAASDGERVVRVRASGAAATPEAVGAELAQQAIDAGADEIIREAS